MDDMCLLKLDEALSDEGVHHEKLSSRKKFIRCKAGVERYSLGRTKLVEIAREAGAVIKIDNTLLIDVETLDKYLETFRIGGGAFYS